MILLIRRTLTALVCVLLATTILSCSLFDDDTEPYPNQPPDDIRVTSGPPQGGVHDGYRIHFYWSGHDPDGPIQRYEYLMTDDERTGPLMIDREFGDIYEQLAALGYTWTETAATSGIFAVTADAVPDSSTVPGDSLLYYGEQFKFHAQHTFFVRAVDSENAVSTLPAYRSFTATTIAPEVTITSPEDDGAPGEYDNFGTDVLFHWTGRDSVGDGSVIEPDSTRFVLRERLDFEEEPVTGLLLDMPDSVWSPWRHWDAEDPGGEVGGRTALLRDLTPIDAGDGRYLFFVQAKDEAGAVTSHYRDGKNLRKFYAWSGLQPNLFVRVLGTYFVFSDTDQVYDYSAAEGQELNLTWLGFADEYGNAVTSYRYAWDLIDEENDEEWSDWSPDHLSAQASFDEGEHTFYVECQDLSGSRTRLTFVFTLIPFTMEYDLLFVDDYDNSPYENPAYGWPAGPENTWMFYKHDDGDQLAWWNPILLEYSGYSPSRDFVRIGITNPVLELSILANYKHVIWEVKESEPGESSLARWAGFWDPYHGFGPGRTDYLSFWLDRGGELLLCGENPILALLPPGIQMGDPDYQRKTPLAFLPQLRYSGGTPEESTAAVQAFLPYRRFGVDAVTMAVNNNPHLYPGHTNSADFKTGSTFWGLHAMGFTGESVTQFGDSQGWLPPDTLQFSADVYAWFEGAGRVFNDPDNWEDPDCEGQDPVDCHHEFGLRNIEVYNWDWFAGVFMPPLSYRPSQYMPLLSYVPADDTTRWGSEPAAEHIHQTAAGDPYCESCYATGSGGPHLVGVVGLHDPAAPSVLLGFPPFYLDADQGQGLIDHILIDIMGMEK